MTVITWLLLLLFIQTIHNEAPNLKEKIQLKIQLTSMVETKQAGTGGGRSDCYHLLLFDHSVGQTKLRPPKLPSGFRPRGAESLPSVNLSVLGGYISQYIPPLSSVRIHYTGHITHNRKLLHAFVQSLLIHIQSIIVHSAIGIGPVQNKAILCLKCKKDPFQYLNCNNTFLREGDQ